jgi:class 3 adenylate cyclase
VALACPTCQGAVEAGQKFCIHCGGVLGADGAEGSPGQSDPVAEATATLPQGSTPSTRRTSSGPLGDRRIVTVLFSDVQGLEGLQQSLDPEEVTDITNSLFKQLSDLIYKYGGTIDKYLSDGLMALFGAPTAHEDDPERAVMAAYEMIERARLLTDKLVARTGVRLSLRCGLHTGLVVAGEVGGDAKKDYTVMGDAVNLAQRVKANAKPDQVLVTVETFRLTQMVFSYNALPPIQVKGREELVHPYELLGPREEEGTGGRERTNLVGRREELSRLHQCLEAATGGRPQLVNVVGEAGIGKSRMVREFLHYFTTYGVGLLLRGRGLSYQQESSYAVVGSMLGQYMSLSPGTSAQDIGEEARNVAETYWPQDAGRRAALLAHLMGAEIFHPEVTHLLPQQKRIAAYLAFNELLVAMARRYTVLVSIEDLHWADEASVEWLASLVDHLAANAHEQIALIILCQYRPREDARFVRFGGKIDLTKIFLNPLPQNEARQLFGVLVGITADPETWPTEIRAVSDAVLVRAGGQTLTLTLAPIATLELESEPSGATVAIAGKPVGTTPTAVTTLAPGTTVAVAFARVGYQSVTTQIAVPRAGEVKRHVQPLVLADDFVRVRFETTPAGAEVLVPGAPPSIDHTYTPAEVFVPVGAARSFLLTMPRRVPVLVEVVGKRGAPIVEQHTLVPGVVVRVEAAIPGGTATVAKAPHCRALAVPFDCTLAPGRYAIEYTSAAGAKGTRDAVVTDADLTVRF